MATNEEFLSTIKEGCIQGWRDHAVLASISGAQAILESNWGKSTLATKANNLFGIKGDYNGESLTVETKEFINKVFKIVDATFRKYPSWSESITDHSAFFTSTEWRKTNYAAVVGETDYKKAAAALSAAGYATDPDYAAKLITLIETNDLQQWDVPETEKEEETKMAYTIIDRRASALGGQSKDRSRSEITTIGWHYTAVLRKNRAFITNHEAYWRDTLGWDRGGYHFYIDADGNIYQNYDYERITWGVANNNGYVVHISVEAGNGNDYSQAQIDAREWLTRKIMSDLNIPASKVKGHWEIYNNTSCPGYTKAQMDAFRAKLAQPAGSTVAAAPVQVAPVPTPTPAPAPVSKWVSESGTFAPDFAINVRSAPNTSGAIVATYNKGQSVRYDSYYNDGRYVWINYKSYSGKDRYMVCRENGKAWGSFS